MMASGWGGVASGGWGGLAGGGWGGVAGGTAAPIKYPSVV